MKNVLRSVIAIALLAPTVAYAQPKPTIPNLDFGVKAGANFAQLSGKSWDKGYKANFLGGFFAGFRMKKIGVQVEAFFSQTKYTTTGKEFYDIYHTDPGVVFNPIVDSAKTNSFNVGYLNIPVLFQFNVLPMLWIQAGPQYSGVVTVSHPDELVQDAKGLFKKGNFSGVVGLEAKLPAHFVIGARYIFGLSSVNNTSVSGAWQQNLIQAHVGYSFL
jgi:hypothetical protein